MDVVEGIFQPRHHPVQRDRKLFKFVSCADFRHPLVEIARRDFFGDGGDLIERPQGFPREQIASSYGGTHNQGKYDCQREKESPQHLQDLVVGCAGLDRITHPARIGVRHAVNEELPAIWCVLFTPRGGLIQASGSHSVRVESGVLRLPGLIKDAAISTSDPKKVACRPWSKMLLNLVDDVFVTCLTDLA